MDSIAIIYAPSEKKEISLYRGIDKILPECIKKLALNIFPIYQYTRSIEQHGLAICEVQFPCLASDIGKMQQKKVDKLCKKIKCMLNKKGIHRIILDDNIKKFESISKYSGWQEGVKLYNGYNLFVMLLEDVLKNVCMKMGINLENISAAIVVDEYTELYSSIIKILCTKVRFLSIISMNYEKFIPLTEEIYNDMGLVIRYGKSIKSIMKDSNLIINFSKNDDLINANRFPSSALIINYGGAIFKRNHNGLIINGIKIKSKSKSLGNLKWIGMPAFCEAVLGLEDVCNDLDKRRYEIKRKKVISDMKTIECQLCGFMGCNGIIDTREMTSLGKNIRAKTV